MAQQFSKRFTARSHTQTTWNKSNSMSRRGEGKKKRDLSTRVEQIRPHPTSLNKKAKGQSQFVLPLLILVILIGGNSKIGPVCSICYKEIPNEDNLVCAVASVVVKQPYARPSRRPLLVPSRPRRCQRPQTWR